MKRRLTSIRLDKIAAVDQPCQEHALVALIKRAPEQPRGPQAIAKATFQEALEGNMIAGAVNDAFYQSFDGLWERNDAFRTALTDELSEGGDGSVASAAYVDSVKSLVDEAVSEARSAGATAADTTAVEKAFSTAATAWLATKSKPKEQTMKITNKAALKAAVAAFNPETSPAAHVGIIQKAATDLAAEDELPAEGILAKSKAPDADLVRKVAILEMPAEVRKHFDALPEAEQPAFLAKSADDRAEIVRKANEGDPVLYKTKGGIEIRKSDGAAVLALAKENDGLKESLAKVQGDLTGTTLEKRAAAYPNVAKKIAVDMLKSVDSLGADSDAGKAVIASLDNMNKGSKGLFKSIGTTEGGGEGEGVGDEQAVADFEKKVDEIMKADKVGRADAMSKARRTEPTLFKQAFPETAKVDEEADA